MKMDRAGLRVKLLGSFETTLVTGLPVTLPTRKAQALLAYLAVRPGQAHARDKLTALLWGDRGDVQARDSLRHTLVAVRKVLPERPPSLTGERRAVTLAPAAVDVDVVRFETLVKSAGTKDLADAAEIYQGDFLDGFVLREPGFEEWLVNERERLRELALGALRRLLELQAGAGSSESAIRTALRLLTLDATQEMAHRALMRLYTQQGRRAAALRQYQTCVGVLQRELETDPEAATRDLYQQIVQHRNAAPSAKVRREPGRKAPSPARAEPPPIADTPLIGRDGELATLRNARTEAEWGHGRVVAIIGEAGVGKTRLLSEVAAEAARGGSRVLLGRSYESAQILPFGPWVDAFRTSGLVADDTVVGGLNPVWRAELVRLFPELAAPGLPAPSDDYLRLFESVASLVAHVASMQPLVLMLEDVHWADEMSLRLLSFVGRRVQAWPVLLVTTARDEEMPDRPTLRVALEELQRETQVSRLTLSPLSRESIASLVRSLIGGRHDTAVTAPLEESVWRVSQGNPFVAGEIVRALRDGTMPLPRRVREVTAGRLERLSDRGRRLTAVAAIIGREFEFALLWRAAGLNESDAADGLEELVRRRVLHGVGERFDFVHDRIRDVAHDEVLPPRRRLLHAAIGEAIEDLHGRNLEPHYAALGTHYRQGERWDKAAVYCRHAGVQAAARSALAEARTWLEQALEAMAKLPESRSSLEQAVDIRFDLRPVLYQLGEVRGGLDNLREAETLAGTLKDDRRCGRVAAYMTNMHVRLGQLAEARASGTRALAIARELEDLDLRVLSTTFLGQVHHYYGEYEQQVELITRNVADLPADWIYKNFGIGVPISLFDRAQLVMSLAHLGRFTEAAQYEAEGIRLAEPMDHPYTVGQPHMAASVFRVLKGDWVKARSLADRAAVALRTRNVAVLLSTCIACSVWARAQLGETSEVMDLMREAEHLLEVTSARHPGTGPRGSVHGWDCHSLGRAYLLLDRPDDAQHLCDLAIESSPPGYAPYPVHLLGDIATHPDRFDAETGEAHYRRALALAEPRGMRPLVAHCHLGLGKLFQRTGKRSGAERHLAEAAAMYRDMEMSFYLEEAQAALRRRHEQ